MHNEVDYYLSDQQTRDGVFKIVVMHGLTLRLVTLDGRGSGFVEALVGRSISILS